MADPDGRVLARGARVRARRSDRVRRLTPLFVAHQDDLPRAAGFDRWLYVGDDTAWRMRAERGVLAGVPRIATGEAIQEEAERLRQPYVDWIGSLSLANDSAEWWASELAAKNSYTMLFSNLCAVAAARRFADEDVLAVCSSRAIAEQLGAPSTASGGRPAVPGRREAARRALSAWAFISPRPFLGLPALASGRARALLDADPRYRRRILHSRGIRRATFSGEDTALLFTWVDARSFRDDGSYRDPHLGVLPELLRASGFRVAFVPRILSTVPFADAVDRLLRSGETFIFPDLYLHLDDWRDCARRASLFEPAVPPDATVAGIPVSRLAHEHVDRYRSAQVSALSYEPLVRNLAAAGVQPAHLIHTYEGHTWELVLIRSVHRHLPGTKVVGFENLNMSRFALSMYPAHAELGLRPMPDRIVTNGPAFRKVLLDQGVPERFVRTGCALRHASLWDERRPARAADGAARVLVATDGVLGNAAELVAKAATALGDDPRYVLTVKCHPLVRQEDVASLLGDLVEQSNVRFTSDPITDLLTDSDVMLYTHSVVCYEALARGVPPVFVQSESIVDLDQLEPFPKLRRLARTPDEIRAAVDELAALDRETLESWRSDARAAARLALAPVETGCVDAFIA